MFRLTTHKQKTKLNKDAERIIKILRENRMINVSSALSLGWNMTNIPAVSYLLLHYDEILGLLNYDDITIFQSTNIINAFTETTKTEISIPYHIPKYNLYNVGNICHLNSCVSMLSSMSSLVEQMNYLKDTSKDFNLINQYILNSYAEVDLNVKLIFDIMSVLNITPLMFEEATETMKKILRILYENGIEKSTVFFWDSTDEFYDTKETFGSKIEHFKPKYLIVNTHDSNSLLDYDTNKCNLQTFKTKSIDYKLISLIAYYPGHFVSLFRVNDNLYKVINDLSDRFEQKFVSAETIYSDNGSHVMACYMSN